MARQPLTEMLLDMLFPPRCVGCKRRGGWICGRCGDGLPVVPGDGCPICGDPRGDGAVCFRCRHDPPEFDSLRGAFLYEGTMQQAIRQLKYHGSWQLARPLALRALAVIGPVGPPDLIVPVPLHPNRLAQRGYNQSALLARTIGQVVGVPVAEERLRRIKDTRAQVLLTGPRRWDNVRDAFEASPGRLDGVSVLLVDDVATTGSTLRAAAAALKHAGATRVEALVIARAV